MKANITLVFWLSISSACCQNFEVPAQEQLDSAIDLHFSKMEQIQLDELTQTKRFRWLAYLPHPGYSPFTGGLSFSLNLTGPLQEIRLNNSARVRKNSITRITRTQAEDLKMLVAADRQAVIHSILEYRSREKLDSLNHLVADLSLKKYNGNEITPSEYIASSKAHEEYLNTRKKENHAIHEAITNLRYKAKMDVAASNAQVDHLSKK